MEVKKMQESLKMLVEALKTIDANIVTEEFTKKLETIFESAVETRISQLREEIENEIQDKATTELQEFKEEVVNNLDKFLDECVNEFNENFQPEIEDTIKSVTYQNIIDSIMETFEKYNIQVPKSKLNIVSALKEENEKNEDKINQLINEKFELEEEILKQKCLRVFVEKTENLTESEKDTLKKLMKDVEFDNSENFENKLSVIIENFLQKENKKPITESVDNFFDTKKEVIDNPEIDEKMIKAYMDYKLNYGGK
jgi:hypothetical protein